MIENKSIGSKVFDVVNVVILILITLVCILPVGKMESAPNAPKKRAFAERAWFNGFGKETEDGKE